MTKHDIFHMSTVQYISSKAETRHSSLCELSVCSARDVLYCPNVDNVMLKRLHRSAYGSAIDSIHTEGNTPAQLLDSTV